MSNTLVMKFGGTSVGGAAAITRLVEIARQARPQWANLVIVVSAMSGVTDLLLNAANDSIHDATVGGKVAGILREKHLTALESLAPHSAEVREKVDALLAEFGALCHAIHVLGEASPRALDAISSLGERMSAPLVAAALTRVGLPARAVDAREVVVTDDHNLAASPLWDATQAKSDEILRPILHAGEIPVLTGFIGASQKGVTTTLGRGGSDFSGAIFGVTLNAEEVWIWTDVPGVMSTDPRIAPNARTIPVMTFREISELAFYGAKVLHPKTIRPVIERGIKLWVKNTFEPEAQGTLIVPDQAGLVPPGDLRSVTTFRGQCIITVEGRGMLGVPGIAARTFGAVARTQTSVVMISQASSEQSICFVVACPHSAQVVATLQDEFRAELARGDIDSITTSADCAIVTVVGVGMRHTPGMAGKIFSALGNDAINVIAIAQGSSECSISLVVESAEANRAVAAIHSLIVA